MKLIEKIKESLLSHIAEMFAVAVIAFLIWIGKQITPIILPAIKENISKPILFSLFISSFFINFILVISIWVLNKKNKGELKLLYGIYWDKKSNPYCPSCKKPGISYDNYSINGLGYLCIPCNKVFPLKDALGNEVKPSRVLSELK
jgi:hypothetical protein